MATAREKTVDFFTAEVPKHERTYDALMPAMEAAAGHHTCTKAPESLVTLNVIVPVNTLLGDPQAKPPRPRVGR